MNDQLKKYSFLVITTLIINCNSNSKDNNNYIPLLNMPKLVSELNKNGFKTEKSIFEDNSFLNESIYISDYMEYRIKLYSAQDENKVSNIRLVANIIEVNKGNIDVSYSLFNDFTKLEILEKSNKIQEAQNWLKLNFNNDKSSLQIEGLLFTIYAPTKFVRMLTIEPLEKNL